MSSNSETVTELCEHVKTLKDVVLAPIQKYSGANAVSTLPPELDQVVQTQTSYASRLYPLPHRSSQTQAGLLSVEV